MGQRAVGILYGVGAPDLPAPDGRGEGDDSPVYQLVQRWEEAKKVDWRAERPRVRCESEGGRELLGVWVAVGGSGEDGAPHFLDECLRLQDVEAAFRREIGRAARLWARFAAWAKKEGVTLPEPTLWLTPCETA